MEQALQLRSSPLQAALQSACSSAARAPRVPVQVEQVHVARQAVRQHAARDSVAVQAAQTADRRGQWFACKLMKS